MKKPFLVIIALCMVASLSAQEIRPTGEKYIVEAALNPIAEGSGTIISHGTNLTASFGYQFNPYLFLGGSTGVYSNDGVIIPLMVDFRYYVMNKKNTPFLGIRLGKGRNIEQTEATTIGDSSISMLQAGYLFGHLSVSLYLNSNKYTITDSVGTSERSNEIVQIGIGWEF